MLNVLGQLTIGTGGNITNTAGDYLIDETGVTLGDNTSINLGTNSFITNNAGDYVLDEEGLRLEVTNDTQLIPDRALSFYDSNDLIGGMYARADDNSLWLQSEPGSDIKLTARGSNDYVSVEFGMFKLPNYTDTTRPSNPEPGAMIYNSDYEGVQVAGETGNWINL